MEEEQPYSAATVFWVAALAVFGLLYACSKSSSLGKSVENILTGGAPRPADAQRRSGRVQISQLSQEAQAAIARGEWEAHYDAKSGSTYYYNPASKSTCWDLDVALSRG
ncbi:hypothetical protein DIPPA_21637 [Diplonema papillatum]|nr:hypothetical protein DIPPA_21637 [Diplonema papillatum]